MTTGRVQFANAVETEGLLLYGAGSAPFDAAVGELFDPAGRAVIAPVLPYSVLVHNATGRYLMAVSIAISYESPVEPGVTIYNRVSPAAPVADRAFMLAPGASIFAALGADISGTLNAAGRRQTPAALGPSTARSIAVCLAMYAARDITITADCFVTEDGALYGPDRAGYQRTMAARRRAETELYEAVASKSGDELRRHLEALAGQEHTMDAPYEFYRSARARLLLDKLEEAGDQTLRKTVALYAAQLAALPEIFRQDPADDAAEAQTSCPEG